MAYSVQNKSSFERMVGDVPQQKPAYTLEFGPGLYSVYSE